MKDDRRKFAKALMREEPCDRTRAYRRKTKRAAVRAERRRERQNRGRTE